MIQVKPHNSQERIGRLDRRITLRTYTESQNAFGEVRTNYEDLATVWAKIEYKAASEQFHAHRETAKSTIFFTIRYRSDFFDKKNQIVFESRTYDIEAVREMGRRQYLEIEATERV